MTDSLRSSLDQVEPFGFRWGQLDVIRMAEYRGRKVLQVRTDTACVEIAVSPKGNNIEVYRNGERFGK